MLRTFIASRVKRWLNLKTVLTNDTFFTWNVTPDYVVTNTLSFTTHETITDFHKSLCTHIGRQSRVWRWAFQNWAEANTGGSGRRLTLFSSRLFWNSEIRQATRKLFTAVRTNIICIDLMIIHFLFSLVCLSFRTHVHRTAYNPFRGVKKLY